MTSSVLALDLGTTMGWALRQSDVIASGTMSFQPDTSEDSEMRFVRFTRWLGALRAVANGVHALYFEEVRNHPSIDVARIYGGFVGHLSAWCEKHGVPYQGVPICTVKKYATGAGNATNEAILDAMRARGHRPFTNHEAEALALLSWTTERHGGST